MDFEQRDGPRDERASEPAQGYEQANEPALAVDEAASEPPPLARVRYGLGKEILLYPDAIIMVRKEEAEELRVSLDSIRRLVLAPGEYTPSKLVLMFDLDDGTTIIAAEGMTNVRDFRKLLEALAEVRPQIELDPPDMDAQLGQALDIRRRHLIGCYGSFLGACLLMWVLFLAVAWIGAHGPR